MKAMTWGELKELMKEADDAMPLKMMVKLSGSSKHLTAGEYTSAQVLSAFESEVLTEGGELILINELPYEPPLTN